MFCVDLVNLLQTLGVDVVVCIYDAFMARVSVSVRVRIRVMLGVRVIVGMLGLWLRLGLGLMVRLT